MVWKVEFFINSRESRPVSEFLKLLDDSTLHKALKVIDLLGKYGPNITMPYSKKITKSISELRTGGKNPIRMLYGRKDQKFVLLSAFKKKTNKLPTKELELAESRFDSLYHIWYKVTMKTHTESCEKFKKKMLEGRPGLRALYAKSQAKHDIICKMIDARIAKKMTQSQLAKKIGTKQAVISRFEGGSSNPSFDFMSKIATAVGKTLRFDLA